MDLRLHEFKTCNEKRLSKPPDDGESPEMMDDRDSVEWTVSSSLLEILVPASSPPETSSTHEQPASTTRSHDATGAPGDGGCAKGYRRQTWPRGPSASAAGTGTATVDAYEPEETTPVVTELDDGGEEGDEMRHDCRIDMHPHEHCGLVMTRVMVVNSLSYSRTLESSPQWLSPSGNVYGDGGCRQGLVSETSPTKRKTSHMNVNLRAGDVLVTIPPCFRLGDLHAAVSMQWKGIEAILRESCVL